jgi:UDP-GlcNAc:undecaprenyl-phosphate/decaprenyl-phosphate GlcNAc-1-phosphate transferase
VWDEQLWVLMNFELWHAASWIARRFEQDPMTFLVPLALSLVLTPVARVAGLRLGLVDSPQPGPLKIHEAPVSLLGGIAVVAATLGGVAIVGRWVPGAVATAAILALGTGLLDDVRPLPAWLRALLQALAGLLLVLGGLRLAPLGPLGAVGVVFLAVACTNAVNMMDGQDGLAGGLTAIAALGLAGLSALLNQPDGVDLGIALAGALAGFLVWNRPPARIFLGNGGAYGIGLLLAALVAGVSNVGGWSGMLAAGTCLGVFVLELVLTVARRARAADSLVGGDRGHSYDVLARFLPRQSVTLGFWGLGAAAALAAIIFSRAPVAVAAPIVGVAGLVALWWVARLSSQVRPPAGS